MNSRFHFFSHSRSIERRRHQALWSTRQGYSARIEPRDPSHEMKFIGLQSHFVNGFLKPIEGLAGILIRENTPCDKEYTPTGTIHQTTERNVGQIIMWRTVNALNPYPETGSVTGSAITPSTNRRVFSTFPTNRNVPRTLSIYEDYQDKQEV